MKNRDRIRDRYLKDALPVRLGGLAADLRRISSSARRPGAAIQVAMMLEESQYFIEWAAPDMDIDVAGEMVELQLELALWKRSWPEAQKNPSQCSLLALQARRWSDRVLALSGLLA